MRCSNRGQGRNARGNDRRLSVFGQRELGFRAIEAQRSNRKAERLIRSLVNPICFRERAREGASHADFLRTLSWKKPRDFHAPALSMDSIPKEKGRRR